MNTRHTLLSGVVGSQAYGLATPDSDTDYLEVFAYSTVDLLGLESLRESIVTAGPDMTRHEVKKFVKLALTCNPTVSELLWLDDYVQASDLGLELVGLRTAFLSRQRVRDAYMGYASQQYNRLIKASTFEQAQKCARHILRLMHQGYGLYVGAYLKLKVDDPQWYFDTARQMTEDLQYLREYMARMELAFIEAEQRSPLPLQPDYDSVNAWLIEVRKAFLTH